MSVGLHVAFDSDRCGSSVLHVVPSVGIGFIRTSLSWFAETISLGGFELMVGRVTSLPGCFSGGLSLWIFSSPMCWSRAGVPVGTIALLLLGTGRRDCHSTCVRAIRLSQESFRRSVLL